MARETKVGLLAGLAFIICFAVILANRGAKGPPGLANSFLPEGALKLPELVQRKQGSASTQAISAKRTGNQTPSLPAVQPPSQNYPLAYANQPQYPVQPIHDPAPPTGAQLPPSQGAEPARYQHESALAHNPRSVDTPSPAGGNSDLERALTSPLRLDSVLRNDTPVPMTATAEPAPAPGRMALQEAEIQDPTKNQKIAVQGTPYTVKSSDTLSSIALSHYGTKSKRAVDSIFEANRGVLADINNVRSGTVLTIPTMTGASVEKDPPDAKKQPETKPAPDEEKVAEAKPKSGAKPSPRKETAEKATVRKVADSLAEGDKNAKNFKWYQVKKNDRFASIAREQLGDAGRWQEVYELNKDKFPDPQKIREGVRIKLPATTALASASKESKERKR